MTAIDQLRKFATDFGVINSPKPEYLMRVRFRTTDHRQECWVDIDVRHQVAINELMRLIVSVLHFDTHEWIVETEPNSHR